MVWSSLVPRLPDSPLFRTVSNEKLGEQTVDLLSTQTRVLDTVEPL